MAEYSMQRQRHGVTKNLVEGVSGFIVGVALFILIGNLLERGPRAKQPTEAGSIDATKGEAERQA